MNFLITAPNHISVYYKFCEQLKKCGCNVLAIGDTPYGELKSELTSVLTEYFFVPTLNDYPSVLSAARQLIDKYGSIAGIESNNEYWLELDAALRRDLDIEGLKPELLESYKYKSQMKVKFTAAGIPVSPYIVTKSANAVLEFVTHFGYPIFAKPNKGVGANSVKKITNLADLSDFFQIPLLEDFIFELYIEGSLYSYDGLTDKNGKIIFEAAHFFETPIAIIKETGSECIYHTLKDIPENLKTSGRRAVHEFDVKGRFFHIEFFRLKKDIKGIGQVGDFCGLEVNMRPAGGFTPEMINAAKEIDVYALWAQVVTNSTVADCKTSNEYFCTNIGRHNKKQYALTNDQLNEIYSKNLVYSAATEKNDNPFGNYEIICKFKTIEECTSFSQSAVKTCD